MKRISLWIIFIAGIFLSVSLARSLYDLTKREQVIHEVQERFSATREENERLQKELEYVQSQAYIEQQARDKLNLAHPGEVVYIVPEVTIPPEKEPEQEKPVWRKWMEVFGF
jgi:cell division protein FtsB/cell division protein DivIC